MSQTRPSTRIILSARQQRCWGWPVVANLFLAGTGSGFYLVILLGDAVREGFATPEAGALALVAAGFMLQALEVGRPGRLYLLLRNSSSSWISREFLFFWGFFIAALLHLLNGSPVYLGLAGFAAAGLLMSQGLILYQAKAIGRWNQWMLPVSSAISGLTSGYGLLMLLLVLHGEEVSGSMPSVGFTLILSNLSVWYVLLAGREKPLREKRKNGGKLEVVIWGGQLLAAGLLAYAAFARVSGLMLLVGILLLAGVLAQKVQLLQKARFSGIYLSDPKRERQTGKQIRRVAPGKFDDR